MAATKTAKSADLLKTLNESTQAAEDGDLLSTITDDDIDAWVPEDEGEGVEGTVLSYEDEMPDEYNDGLTVPVVTIEQDDGEQLRIIGYATVLRKEIRKCAPRPGDRFAVKFIGDRAKKRGKFAGKPVHIYKAAVRRGQQTHESAPF